MSVKFREIKIPEQFSCLAFCITDSEIIFWQQVVKSLLSYAHRQNMNNIEILQRCNKVMSVADPV